MDQAFGTSRAAATVAESGERGGRFVFCKERQGKLDTAPNNGGPGKGDIYTYLRNARFAWIAANGPVRLVYLGAEGTVTTTTSAILAALESDDPSDLSALGLTEETALALLDLNPYVSTATPNLSLPRYYWVDQLTMGCGGGQGFSNGFSLGDETLQETHQTTNRVYTETQNAEPGFLSFLGLGVTESVNYSLELRQWNYSSESTSGSRHAAVNLYCSAVESDPYVLDVYLDVVFNTYAITELTNTKAGPWIKGVAYGNDGKALARKKIVLESGGQRHRTFTDKNGQFQIYARNLKPGRAVIHSAVSRLHFGFNRNRLPATIELRPVGTKIKYRELKKHVPHELPTPTVPAMPVKPIHN